MQYSLLQHAQYLRKQMQQADKQGQLLFRNIRNEHR